jgi:hypothetical protein
MLPGRTDNRIKNRFHSLIRNALIRKNLMSLPYSNTSCIKKHDGQLIVANSINLIQTQDTNKVENHSSDDKGQTIAGKRPFSRDLYPAGTFSQELYPSSSTSSKVSPSKSLSTGLKILNESDQKFMDYPSSKRICHPITTLGSSVFTGEEDHCYDEGGQGVEHELNGSELLQSLKGIPGLSRPKDQSEEIYFKKS